MFLEKVHNYPMRVLCLDIEGGHGGSSRSLFEFLRNISLLDTDIKAEVWHRKVGPINKAYKQQNICARVTPLMPKATSVGQFSRNCVEYGRFLFLWLISYQFRKSLLNSLNRFDLIHFNHEGLFLLAKWLRKKTSKPITLHIRTIPPESVFSRWQARTIARSVDGIVAISELEAEIFNNRSNYKSPPHIIYNPVSIPSQTIEPHSNIPRDERLKLASLSNFALVRGVDRLVDLAVVLKQRNVKNVLFVMAGDMALPKNFPEKSRALKGQINSLEDYAAKCGVREFFIFLGHTNYPESVLAGCDGLIKLSRGQGGRDILEALGAGKPVLTLGKNNQFLENEKTAIIFSEYDVGAIADAVIDLANNRIKLSSLGIDGKKRVIDLCDPQKRALDLISFWQEIIAAKCRIPMRSNEK